MTTSEDTPLSLDDSLKYYQLTRDYIIHEDTLINYRLSWLLTIQGLLFAAYGLAIRSLEGKNSDLSEKNPDLLRENLDLLGENLDLLISALKWLGLLTSVLCFTGIFAAVLAIKKLSKTYEKSKDHSRVSPLIKVLPKVTGGSSEIASTLGYSPLPIPVLFFVIWWILIGYPSIIIPIIIPTFFIIMWRILMIIECLAEFMST